MILSESVSSSERITAKKLDFRFTIFNVLSGIFLGAAALVAQPFQYYLKTGLHLPASEVSLYMAFMMFPWLCKPAFGLLSDNFPLFGYRRKSYLILVNALAALCSCLIVLQCKVAFVFSYAVLQIAMATSTVITLGLGIEYGRQAGFTRKYLLVQTIFYHIGVMSAAVFGGWLCKANSAQLALTIALPTTSLFALVLALVTLILMIERKDSGKIKPAKLVLGETVKRVVNRSFLLVAVTILLWSVSLALSVPLYFFETNTLHFKQDLIGILSGVNSAGMLFGAAIYACFIKQRDLRMHLVSLVVLGLISIFSYAFLSAPPNAIAIEAARGMVNMISLLIIYGLAAEICPPGSEVFIIGYLVALRTLGMEFWTAINGYLFTNLLHEQFQVLTIVAGLIAASAAIPVILLLKESGGQATEKIQRHS